MIVNLNRKNLTGDCINEANGNGVESLFSNRIPIW